MSEFTKEAAREIIDDFAAEIDRRQTESTPPKEVVIDFRDDRQRQRARKVFLVPIELLRYRKDNGRISSNVLGYQKDWGILDEKKEDAQGVIRAFLEDKDPEKTDELMHSIEHDGQREPAIITCDGFLINGNRRKMVLETLQEKHHGSSKYSTMKVVILPGKGDEGGPPHSERNRADRKSIPTPE